MLSIPLFLTLFPYIHATLLRHRGILFLKSFAQALRALKELVYAAHHAALFLGLERLGGEVRNAVVEAALNEVRVHLRRMYQSLVAVMLCG
jgi:pyruvate formate-lyase activating enzyme-like uncharacterized protein